MNSISLVLRVFANGLGNLGSIPGWVIPKTQKMVLDASLLNTQYNKVWIKGKVEQSRERSSALSLHLGIVAIEKGTFRSPSTKVANFIYLFVNLAMCLIQWDFNNHILQIPLLCFQITFIQMWSHNNISQHGSFNSLLCCNQSLFFFLHGSSHLAWI